VSYVSAGTDAVDHGLVLRLDQEERTLPWIVDQQFLIDHTFPQSPVTARTPVKRLARDIERLPRGVRDPLELLRVSADINIPTPKTLPIQSVDHRVKVDDVGRMLLTVPRLRLRDHAPRMAKVCRDRGFKVHTVILSHLRGFSSGKGSLCGAHRLPQTTDIIRVTVNSQTGADHSLADQLP
jgi:hypothetical protein